MIELFYSRENNRWHQKSSYQYVYWGKEPSRLSPSPAFSSSIIKLQTPHDAIRPLVGILAGSNLHHHFSGNAAIFKSIQNELTDSGGLSYVFTPDDIYPSYINGYLYDATSQKWTGFRFPYPNIVYNRIPDRAEERTPKVRSFFNLLKLKSIPFFNRSFFLKNEILNHLAENETLMHHIPATACFTDANLNTFLKTYSSIFCKPASGSKGRGIFKIKSVKSGFQFTDHENTRFFPNLALVKEHVTPLLHEQYLIQREIDLATHNEYPYDFRILLQKPFKSWQVTGIGIRAAQNNSLTTHVPRGGKVLPFHKVATNDDEGRVRELAIRTAESLEEKEKMLECSLDIGKDSEGHFWIFEANSKPMRFDEPLIHQAFIGSLLTSFRTYSAY